MDRVRTVATFIAGVLVGGSAVYFSPPNRGTSSTGPGGPTAQMTPPFGAQPGMSGGTPGGAPAPGGAAGVPGTLPGAGAQPGAGGQPGADGQIPSATPGMGGAPGAMGEGGVAAVAQPASAAPSQDPNLPRADGAQGPPPDEVPAAPPGTQQQSGSRLEKHLRMAEELWNAQATVAKASSKDGVKKLAPEIELHAQSVPKITEHMPPMQEVAGYLATSRVLLDRMSAAGMDVADLSLQVDMMMRPPKGKIPGGPKGAQSGGTSGK